MTDGCETTVLLVTHVKGLNDAVCMLVNKKTLRNEVTKICMIMPVVILAWKERGKKRLLLFIININILSLYTVCMI